MSRTKIPDQVVIYGLEVPVEFSDEIKDEKGNTADGHTDGKTTSIHPDAPKKEHLGILLHEMWHCYIKRSGIFYREDHDTNLEEQMAEGFAAVIQENFILKARSR